MAIGWKSWLRNCKEMARSARECRLLSQDRLLAQVAPVLAADLWAVLIIFPRRSGDLPDDLV